MTIRERGLTRAHLDRLIEAREADFDEEPPAALAGLEDYAEGTSSQLVYLALEALGVRDAAAVEAGRHVGIAYALSGLLRAMPYLAARGRPIVPLDIAARHSLEPEDDRRTAGYAGGSRGRCRDRRRGAEPSAGGAADRWRDPATGAAGAAAGGHRATFSAAAGPCRIRPVRPGAGAAPTRCRAGGSPSRHCAAGSDLLGQRPRKSGRRRSAIALTPSAKSSVRRSQSCSTSSRSVAASIASTRPRRSGLARRHHGERRRLGDFEGELLRGRRAPRPAAPRDRRGRCGRPRRRGCGGRYRTATPPAARRRAAARSRSGRNPGESRDG